MLGKLEVTYKLRKKNIFYLKNKTTLSESSLDISVITFFSDDVTKDVNDNEYSCLANPNHQWTIMTFCLSYYLAYGMTCLCKDSFQKVQHWAWVTGQVTGSLGHSISPE